MTKKIDVSFEYDRMVDKYEVRVSFAAGHVPEYLLHNTDSFYLTIEQAKELKQRLNELL